MYDLYLDRMVVLMVLIGRLISSVGNSYLLKNIQTGSSF